MANEQPREDPAQGPGGVGRPRPNVLVSALLFYGLPNPGGAAALSPLWPHSPVPVSPSVHPPDSQAPPGRLDKREPASEELNALHDAAVKKCNRDDDDDTLCLLWNYRSTFGRPRLTYYTPEAEPGANDLQAPEFETHHFVDGAGEPFSAYKAIIRHPNLFFRFVICLPPPTLFNLYSIDKEFHYRLNNYSSSIIYDYARYHVPDAAFIFGWSQHRALCISDPITKPMDHRSHLARDIPSFRWIAMVLLRDRIIHRILQDLAMSGLRFPRRTKAVLMKLWVLIDTRTQAKREGFLQDKNLWSDEDILLFHHFLMKLNMRFGEPAQGKGMCSLAHLLISYGTFNILKSILRQDWELAYTDIEEMLARAYRPDLLRADQHPWLIDEMESGIPEEDLGLLMREGWTWRGDYMKHAIDLIIIEGFKRGLRVGKWLPEFLRYGFIHAKNDGNLVLRPQLLVKNGKEKVEEEKKSRLYQWRKWLVVGRTRTMLGWVPAMRRPKWRVSTRPPNPPVTTF